MSSLIDPSCSGTSQPGYNLETQKPLGANQTFTGNPINVSSIASGFILVEANSDQTGTLYVDYSEDSFATVAFSVSTACGPPSSPVVAGTYPNSAQIKTALYGGQLRIRYVNGANAQTVLQISRRFSS